MMAASARACRCWAAAPATRTIRRCCRRSSGRTSDYLHDFYGDTALFGGGIQAVRCGLEFFGSDHVVFATDTPLGPIAPTIDTIRRLDIAEERPAQDILSEMPRRC